jgi:hypothetical protein
LLHNFLPENFFGLFLGFIELVLQDVFV